jgi:branched-chain amino acid transport system permease protein
MSLSSRSLVLGWPLLKSDIALYYASFVVLALTYLLLATLIRSRFGRVLRGIKENPVRMEAIGFSPFRFQLTAYVLAGLIAALAGCLLANQTGFVSPAYSAWQRSGDLIFMVVLGGLGSLTGAIIGAAVFTILTEILSGWTEYWGMIFGPLLIVTVLFARQGLTGLAGGRPS